MVSLFLVKVLVDNQGFDISSYRCYRGLQLMRDVRCHLLSHCLVLLCPGDVGNNNLVTVIIEEDASYGEMPSAPLKPQLS